jgi:Rho GDP-dissociation inhibitor
MSSSPPPKPTKPSAGAEADDSEVAVGASSSSSSSSAASEDAAPSVFQFSETASKNVADILALDSEDESLRRYKESLLGSAAHGDLGDTNDPRRLVVTEFAVVFEPSEGRPDIIHRLDTEEGCATLRNNGIQMKEGVKFKFRISFRVQVGEVNSLCSQIFLMQRTA